MDDFSPEALRRLLKEAVEKECGRQRKQNHSLSLYTYDFCNLFGFILSEIDESVCRGDLRISIGNSQTRLSIYFALKIYLMLFLFQNSKS